MPQKFAFTTAAMAAALEETAVSYEDLADIERAFDDAETDISESPYKRPRALSYQIDQLCQLPACPPLTTPQYICNINRIAWHLLS